ncbi:C80 family cysteine peptidase [Spartinivicinus ruber]|uniref:C80 family cysteine peptidase n=1 Tax=Spartinivicinus ruber TaxID=2683272 RepID=UPI0013D4A926|nr:C80 family cysteine peptidase [Spartinivicinus ruber]
MPDDNSVPTGTASSTEAVANGQLSFEDKLANFILASAYSNEHIEGWLEGAGIPANAKPKVVKQATKAYQQRVSNHIESWRPYLAEGRQVNIKSYLSTSPVKELQQALKGVVDVQSLTAQQLKGYLLHPETIPGITSAKIAKIKSFVIKDINSNNVDDWVVLKEKSGGASEIRYDTVAVTVIDKTLYFTSNTKTRSGVTVTDNPDGTTHVEGLENNNKYLSFSLFQDQQPTAENPGGMSHAANRVNLVDQLQAELKGVAEFDKVVFIGIGDTAESAEAAAAPHAEMQLIRYLKDHNIELKGKRFGISKPACSECEAQLKQYGIEYRSGESTGEGSNQSPKNWLEPDKINNNVDVRYEASLTAGANLNDYRAINALQWRKPTQNELERSPLTEVSRGAYDSNIILQADGDPVSFRAAQSLFHKYPSEKVRWLQWNPHQGNMVDVLTGQQVTELQLSNNDRLLAVGHSDRTTDLLTGGHQIAGVDATTFSQNLFESGLVKGMPKRISLLACGLGSVDQAGSSFVKKLAQALVRYNPTAKVEISARDTLVRINSTGQRETLRFMADGTVAWQSGDHSHKVILTTDGEGQFSEVEARYGEGESSSPNLDIITDEIIADALTNSKLVNRWRQQQVDYFANLEQSIKQTVAKPIEATLALSHDHGVMVKVMASVLAEKNSETGRHYEIDEHSLKVDLTTGDLQFNVVDVNDPRQRPLVKTKIPTEELRTPGLVDEYHKTAEELSKPQELKGSLNNHINRGLAIYGIAAGLKGGIQALEQGRITEGSIALSQASHGIGELTGINRKLYKAAGQALTKVLSRGVQQLGQVTAEVAGREVGQLLTEDAGSLLRTAGRVGELLEDVPIIGTAFGIYNIEQDLQRGDTLGYIDAGLDGAITALSLAGPEAEPIVIALTIIRMGIDEFYTDIKKELDALPADASAGQKAEAVFTGIGKASFHLWEEWTLPGQIYGAVTHSKKLDQEYVKDQAYLNNLADYHNYFKVEKEQGDNVQEINFANGSASWNGGNITFRLGEPGQASTLNLASIPDSRGNNHSETHPLNLSNNVNDIVLGVGESEKISFKEQSVKFLWFIPVDKKRIISGIDEESTSLHGTYYGNSQDNRFIAVQQQPKDQEGNPIRAIAYKFTRNKSTSLNTHDPNQQTASYFLYQFYKCHLV